MNLNPFIQCLTIWNKNGNVGEKEGGILDGTAAQRDEALYVEKVFTYCWDAATRI